MSHSHSLPLSKLERSFPVASAEVILLLSDERMKIIKRLMLHVVSMLVSVIAIEPTDSVPRATSLNHRSI